MKLFFLLLTPLLTSIVALSVNSPSQIPNLQANEKCPYIIKKVANIQLQQDWWEESKTCFIGISPANIIGLRYRSYFIDNSGFFMVFNSYGDGNESETAGSRSFFVLPQVHTYPEFSFTNNNDVIIKMVSGHELRVSGKDFSIVSLSHSKITEKPLSPNNQGGVEFKLDQGFWFDAGFRLGGTKFDNPSNKTKIQSAQSTKICSLKNSSFLNYDSDNDFKLKYTGPALVKFLQTKCPQLQF